MPPATLNLSRLEWNALIERLIETSGEDAEARSAIASLGATLRPKKSITLDASVNPKSNHVSGMTPQHGNVEIETDRSEKISLQLGHGTEERIGYYRISRMRRKRLLFFPYEDLILIHHHWKSDLTTGSDTELPQAWCLCCDTRMEPVWFGRVGYTTAKLGWLAITTSEIEELWGPKPGALHYLAMAARVDTTE